MKLTVFTPTYNRADKIAKVYSSLIGSLNKIEDGDEVEWIVVDDGSSDGTESAVRSFASADRFDVRYFYKENGGKPSAFNVGIEKASGQLFVCLDDDDYLTENALSGIFRLGKKYLLQGYGGFVGRVVSPHGELLGKTCFEDTLVSNTVEIRDKYKFWGEPEVYYTEYLKQYRFPIFPNEKFVTEAYVFDELSLKYPLVYTNEVMMVKEFFAGGLTDRGLEIRAQNPIGTTEYYRKRFFYSKGTAKWKALINYYRFAYFLSARNEVKAGVVWKLLAVPLGAYFHRKDRKALSSRSA